MSSIAEFLLLLISYAHIIFYPYVNQRESILKLLNELGEDPPRDMGDSTLKADIDAMNQVLKSQSNDSLLNMHQANDKKLATLLRLYADLILVLHYSKNHLIASVALKMIEITLKNGLTPAAPLSFAYYGEFIQCVSANFEPHVLKYVTITSLSSSIKGEMLASTGKIEEACRLGRIALKLVEKNASSLKYKSAVVLVVYQTIFWYTEPLQSVAESHLMGHKAGQQLGDLIYSSWNLQLSILLNYIGGNDLIALQKAIKDCSMKLIQKQCLFPCFILLHSQVTALTQGLHLLDTRIIDNIPTEAELFAKVGEEPSHFRSHKLIRAFLFRQLNDLLDEIAISELTAEAKLSLRPMLYMRILFEGLACFLCSREAEEPAKTALIEKGQSILREAKSLAKHSSWNWQNKVLLLDAMNNHTIGNLEEAGRLYISSIQSAREHRFIHEEAVASELTGEYLFEMGRQSEAYALYDHSIKCFEEWGAQAVVKRVKADVQSKFGTDVSHLEATNIDSILGIPSNPQTTQSQKKKRSSHSNSSNVGSKKTSDKGTTVEDKKGRKKAGRGGDERMNLAFQLKKQNPDMSLLDSLLAGGFVFPNLHVPGVKTSEVKDTDDILLSQRKNQLNRRLREDRNRKT